MIETSEYLNNELYKNILDFKLNLDVKSDNNLQDIFQNDNKFRELNLLSLDKFYFNIKNKKNIIMKEDYYFKEAKDIRHILRIKKKIPTSIYKDTYDFLVSSNKDQIELIKNYNKVYIFRRYKNGNKDDPKNYRYFQNNSDQIKLICCYIKYIIDLVLKKDYINTDIFICKIKVGQNVKNCVDYAEDNTRTIDRLLLLDLIKAFDSVELKILYKTLDNFFNRNILDEYLNYKNHILNMIFIILYNREVYYENKIINCNRGLPQGLPISNYIFTLFLSEIVYEWNIKAPKNIIEKLNIYVDDIYILFLNNNNNLNNIYTYNLIKHLDDYYLKINIDKCKMSKDLKLDLNFSILNKFNTYLGLTFTRSLKDILKIFEIHINKYNLKYNKNNTIYDVYYIFKYEKMNNIKKRSLNGWINYKFKHILKNNNLNILELLEIILIESIKKIQ